MDKDNQEQNEVQNNEKHQIGKTFRLVRKIASGGFSDM